MITQKHTIIYSTYEVSNRNLNDRALIFSMYTMLCTPYKNKYIDELINVKDITKTRKNEIGTYTRTYHGSSILGYKLRRNPIA